jgi:hypothetical protein
VCARACAFHGRNDINSLYSSSVSSSNTLTFRDTMEMSFFFCGSNYIETLSCYSGVTSDFEFNVGEELSSLEGRFTLLHESVLIFEQNCISFKRTARINALPELI